jgi:hypothetical protein
LLEQAIPSPATPIGGSVAQRDKRLALRRQDRIIERLIPPHDARHPQMSNDESLTMRPTLIGGQRHADNYQMIWRAMKVAAN